MELNRLELDVDALKKQEKCGTCGAWKREEGIMGLCDYSGFPCTEDSVCYHIPLHWKPIPNPEESLKRLRQKQADIVGIDNYELAKLEIKKQNRERNE